MVQISADAGTTSARAGSSARTIFFIASPLPEQNNLRRAYGVGRTPSNRRLNWSGNEAGKQWREGEGEGGGRGGQRWHDTRGPPRGSSSLRNEDDVGRRAGAVELDGVEADAEPAVSIHHGRHPRLGDRE